jgi:thiol-disulfide isomerase/thioredoxin
LRRAIAGCLAVSATASPLQAKPPTVQDALTAIQPIQVDVPFDRPDKDQMAKCVLESINEGGVTGYVVRNETGQILRRFLDTNKDTKLDIWCYYRDGIETYRDIDSNFNGRTDEYRWLGTAGIRWGVDDNEDGKIDRWRAISAEEVTAELIAAVRQRDSERFQRLLISEEELKGLGLGEQRFKELAEKLPIARSAFRELAGKQKLVTSKTEWTNFGATQPGVVPAGSDGSTRDVIVYENVSAMTETDGKSQPVSIGTLVQVDATWRLIDLPPLDTALASAPTGHFFAQVTPRVEATTASEPSNTAEIQKLVDQLGTLDKDLASADPDEIAEVYQKRADLLEQLYNASSGEDDRSNWLRQLADSLSAAAQATQSAESVERLGALVTQLKGAQAPDDQIAYVAFRSVMAEHELAIQDEKADFNKIQATLEENLAKVIADHPKASSIVEAMMQLANVYEFGGKDQEAAKVYRQIKADYADSELAKRAAGAVFRLECVGKSMPLKGRILDGKSNNGSFDLTQLKGKTVLVHYWATWCERCKEDMTKLRELQAKYAKQGLVLVGVNLDAETEKAGRFVQVNKLPWTQLYETGGMDGRLALEMGIVNLPTMILVDKDGKVIANEMHAVQLESELSKLFKESTGSARKASAKSDKKSTK